MNGYHRSESGKKRAEVGSTRWVYNKFLRTQTKLRWVCGLCNVWCKDENGFKCHLEHENHIRKSQMARESMGRQFKMTPKDEAFAQRFVTYIAQHYLNQKVLLHKIYSEMYPKDAKPQLLIKETCWGTLGVFINALSKAGEIEAFREVKGWMVRVGQDRLIAAELEADARERAGENMLEAEEPEPSDAAAGGAWEDYTLLKRPTPGEGPSCLLARRGEPANVEVPQSRADRMQASWAKLQEGIVPMREKSPPRPDDGGAARAAARARKAARGQTPEAPPCRPQAERGGRRLDARPVRFALKRPRGDGSPAAGRGGGLPTEGSPGRAAEAEGCSNATKPPEAGAAMGALPPGLVVKVLCPRALGGHALRRKARTLAPGEADGGEACGVTLRLLPPVAGWTEADCQAGLAADFLVPQTDLETVLPKLGGRVRILQKGPFWHCEGRLRSLEIDSFSCSVDVAPGSTLRGLPYDRVCKIWDEGQHQRAPIIIQD